MGIGLSAFLMTGCGGDSVGKNATLTKENMAAVAAATKSVLFGTSTDTPSYSKSSSEGNGQSSLDIVLKRFPSTIRPMIKGPQIRKLGATESGACAYGGSVQITTTGTSTNGTAQVTYNQCDQGSVVVNGTLFVQVSPNAVSATMTNLRAVYTNGSEEYYASATLSAEETSTLETVELKMTGYTKTSTDRMDFNNFGFKTSKDNSDLIRIWISGNLKTPCLDSWISFATPEAISGYVYQSCPTSGKVIVSANGASETLRFNSDGSVDQTLNGETTHYDSCSDLDSSSNSCSAD